MRRFWSFSFFFLEFAGVAFLSAFIVLYYQKLGFSGAQIGLLTGLSPLLTLACAPLWTGLADLTRRPRPVLSVALLGSGLGVVVFPFLRTFVPVLALSIGYSICWAPVNPLADSAAVSLLAGDREMYGRLRLGGTIGYALAAPLAGYLVQQYGLAVAFWGNAATVLLAVLVAQVLWPPASDMAVPAYAPRAGRSPVSAAVRKLMTNPRWLLFLAGAFAGGLGLSAANVYFFPYLKELGATESTMGIALSLGVVLEIPLLFFGHHLLRWLKSYRLFLAALVISGVRLLLFALARDTGQAMVIQMLNGLCFPAFWLAVVAYAAESAPAGLSATAQGLVGATVFGVSSAVGGFAGGLLLAEVGAHAMFLVFGLTLLGLTALVVAAGWWLDRRAPL